MKRTILTTMACVALLCTGAVMTGCTDAEAWRRAELNDSADTYKEFLEEYPDSDHAAEAIKRIESQEYTKAVDLGTAEGFGAYLANHPEGGNADDARLNHARLLFEEAKLETSADKMSSYLSMYPEGDSALLATHFLKVYEYATHIDIANVEVKEVNLQRKPDMPLDGHAFLADVTNNGDKTLTTLQIRMEWLSEADVVLLKRLWYVATPPLDMYPTSEDMRAPMKPAETRQFEYIFGRSIKPSYWDGKLRLRVHDIKFEGEADAVKMEQ